MRNHVLSGDFLILVGTRKRTKHPQLFAVCQVSARTYNPYIMDRIMDSFSANVTIREKNLPDFPDPASTTYFVVSSYVQMLSRVETPFGISVLCALPDQLEGNSLLIKIFTIDRTLEERDVSFPTDRPLQTNFNSSEIPKAFIVPPTISEGNNEPMEARDLFVRIDQTRRVLKHGPYFRPGIWSPKSDVQHVITPVGGPRSSITYIFKFRTLSELHSIGMPAIPPDHLDGDSTEPENRRHGDLYCRCKKIIMGGAITCDNDRCKIKTWHRWCVGLKTEAEDQGEGEREELDDVGNLWLCPECRELPRDEIEIAGEDTNEKPARWEQKCLCPVGEAF